MKVRVLVTTACNRHCGNCCNNQGILSQAIQVNCIEQLLGYKEIIITGGEPMLIPDKLFLLLDSLRNKKQYLGKIYLYTALFNNDLRSVYRQIFQYINGIHFTLHYEATDREVQELKLLSETMPTLTRTLSAYHQYSNRLSIDNRLYSKFDFSNINFSVWDVIRKLQWQDNCQVPNDEKLVMFEL